MTALCSVDTAAFLLTQREVEVAAEDEADQVLRLLGDDHREAVVLRLLQHLLHFCHRHRVLRRGRQIRCGFQSDISMTWIPGCFPSFYPARLNPGTQLLQLTITKTDYRVH